MIADLSHLISIVHLIILIKVRTYHCFRGFKVAVHS